MYIKVNFVLSFCITITIICVNKLVWAGDKFVESNTIVVQNGNDGGDDDHDEESSIIYTPIPIPIPMKLKKSIVNPSYLYPIHQDPSMPSYRMTQRSIIHVPSPAPNLQPTPNNFYSRFRTVPPTHYALPPSYNDRLPMPIHPSSNERQSSQPSQPQPPPPPLVLSSPIPPPLPLSGPVPTGPPMHLSQSRPSVSTNSPSFFPPIQPIPSVAQVSDDRDNRYFSLHEPWPPAYTNTNGDKNTIKMTTSTEVQNDGNSEVLPEDERNPNNNANNNNMAGPDDGRNGLVDYPPADQDYGQNYQANYDRPDYPANTDYREDYQEKANKPGGDGVTETVDEGNGGGIDDDYYQDYQNPRDYNDYQGKQVENDVAQPNLNYPSDSQEVVNYHNQDANDYQAGGQEPVYGDGYPANELPNQSNEQKQSNYEEGNHQSSQSTSLPPSPQTDYTQDYADDYYSLGNGQGTSNEQTDVNNNQIDNPDNNEEDENQRNDNERSFDQLAPKPLNQFTKESTSIPDRPMDYPYSSDGYNEPSMSPFESTPMVTIPLNPGTEPGVRPDPINEFDLTGDPYLDNYGRSMRDKSQPNSMENHINQINDGDYGKRNQQYHFNNVKDSSSRPNDYPLSNDQQNDDSTPPAQSNYNNDWPMENDYYQQNRQPMISQSAQPPSLQSPSSPSQLDSNRELDSPIDRYDPEDWGQY